MSMRCRVGVGLVYGCRPTLHPGMPLLMQGMGDWCRACRVKPNPSPNKKRDGKNVGRVDNPTRPTPPAPGRAS